MTGKIIVGQKAELCLSDQHRRRWGIHPGVEMVVQETPEGLLLRPSDPPLSKVYIEPTSECNLRCLTCVRNTWDEPIGSMPMATYHRLIEGLRNVPTLRTFSFWGIGEPLMHPGIVEMVRMASGLKVKTEIITNGMLLNKETAEGLVDAGLDTIIVSVDGASAEAFSDIRGGAVLTHVKENVNRLQAIRQARRTSKPEIGIQFVVMKRNLGELAGLRLLAKDIGATFIILSNLLPYTPELSKEILYWLWAGSSYQSSRSPYNPELILPRIEPRREALQPLIGLLEHHWLAPPPLPYREGASGYCQFVGEGAVAIGHTGDVSPCVPLMHSYTCYIRGREKRFRRYVLGNLGGQDIMDIWNGDEYVQYRKRLLEFDFPPCTDCAGCEMAESNEEDCIGNTFPTCGDCLWAKGVVHCP